MSRPTRTIQVLLATLFALALTGATLAQQDPQATNPQPIPEVELQTLAEGLTSPVTLTAPADDARRFVVDRTGYIYILDEQGNLLEEPFLDISDRIVELQEGFDERGLLGLAFHPNYEENGRFYVYYSAPLREEAPDDWNHTARVSEFKAAAPEQGQRSDSNVADMNSERILMEIDQPQFNHDGGAVAFGPEGYLYIALGDGGGANDVGLGHPPIGHGQDTHSLLGSILRIDVDRGWPGYAVPEDNPFVNDPSGEDEIYSWGWRNPWRMSFDRQTGDLYVATNGQNLWEAVYLANDPGNYGWNILEGTHCFDPQNPSTTRPATACASVGPLGWDLQLPVIEYPHVANQGDAPVAGNSVIGGYVYRGDAIPGMQGYYVFGDWSQSFSQPQGQVLVATPSSSRVGAGDLWSLTQLRMLDRYVLGFGEDSEGELYVLTTETSGPTGETGAIHKIVPAEGTQEGEAAGGGGEDADGADAEGDAAPQDAGEGDGAPDDAAADDAAAEDGAADGDAADDTEGDGAEDEQQ